MLAEALKGDAFSIRDRHPLVSSNGTFRADL